MSSLLGNCLLDENLCECCHREGSHCTNKNKCCFQEQVFFQKEQAIKKVYVRPERWYARYTMGVR